MRKITCYATRDGVVHEYHRRAKAHAEKRYGDAITTHAHRLAALDKYMDISKYLDENAHILAELAELKDDIDVKPTDCQFPED